MLLEIEDEVFAERVDDVMIVLKLVEFTVEKRHSWLPAVATAESACRFLMPHRRSASLERGT